MEINVHKFQEAILAGTFEHTAVHVTAAAFKKDGIADALTKVFADVRAAIEKDQLIQADLVVDFPEPTTITVETGIINLPFANVNKIPNFLEPDEIVPVRVYLIVASPFVNISGLRIDEAATAADYLQDFDTINAQMTASVQEKLELAKPKETVKEVPANKQKTTAKKTTRRTTTKKKTTTRKTTKKSTSASKAAPKRTTTKKTTTRKTTKK